MQIVPALEIDDGFVEIEVRLAQVVLFRLNV